jgi:hypothetical protein
MKLLATLLATLLIVQCVFAESWWYHYCSPNCKKYSPSAPTYNCKENYDYYSGDYHAWRDNYQTPSMRFHKCCAKAGKQSCAVKSKHKGPSEAGYIWKTLFEAGAEAAVAFVAA